MRARSLPALAALLVALLAGGDASADVIGPPDGCPRGSTIAGRRHGTMICRAAPTCARDGDCAADRICEWSALCIEAGEVLGICSAGGDCPDGRCERATRCAER